MNRRTYEQMNDQSLFFTIDEEYQLIVGSIVESKGKLVSKGRNRTYLHNPIEEGGISRPMLVGCHPVSSENEES
jgi:hypothetical protein